MRRFFLPRNNSADWRICYRGLSLIGLTLLLLLPSPLLAFNPHYVVADDDIFDASAMTLRDIQRFLDTRTGTLKYYIAIDTDGLMRTAAEIIWRAAQQYHINPKYILTTLQKEQSLIDDPHPSQNQYDWAMGFGICDSCDKDHPGLQQYRGFAAQIDRAAWRNRYYAEHPNEFTYSPQKMIITDGVPITPVNQATANLYNYTPHIRGNVSFFSIFERWFVKRYPDGTLLRAKGSPGVWLIADDTRRPITSKAVLASRFNPKYVIEVMPSDLLLYPQGQPLKFSNYSLLRAPWGTIYLIVDNERRGIISREIFRRIGFNPEEVIPVAKEDLAPYTEGKPITLASAYPTGALLKDKVTEAIAWVENGARHPVLTQDILRVNFPKRPFITVDQAALMQFPEESPITLPTGTLIKTTLEPTIFVITDGVRRPLASMETFQALGYKKENIITVDEKTIELHTLGDPIEFYPIKK
ncbi:MAG: hypothetical protein Q7S16_05570 [bacterium]|nr:hypothetical protein [bacterium]